MGFLLYSNLPIISALNRTLGAIFGLFEGILVIGIVFYMIDRYPLPWPDFMAAAAASKVVTICEGIASLLWPLLPAVLVYYK